MDLGQLLASMKGGTPTGFVSEQAFKQVADFIRTCEPGDLAISKSRLYSAAPQAYDLWYLWTNMNFMQKYYAYSDPAINGDTYDYTDYITGQLDFLSMLNGLKPLKTMRALAQLVDAQNPENVFYDMRPVWQNKGIYWINLLAFELWQTGLGAQWGSPGPKGQDPNGYVGYITFPIGQVGIMEVISVLQQSDLQGSQLLGGSIKDPMPLDNTDAIATDSPSLFPDPSLAGRNYCFGDHLMESGYRLADEDVELFSTDMCACGYGEDVKPKKWMRYWINNADKFPVPGEFIGILCRPVALPPHLWWFQESNPFLYAGNWVDAYNVTTGIITDVTLEADRDDGKPGNQYDIKIQGCEVTLEGSDFLLYSVGDRVAVVKLDTIGVSAEKSFNWLIQNTFIKADEQTEKSNYIIVPISFYKETE